MDRQKKSKNPIVFLDIKIGEEKVGRVIIELFQDVVPKTVENFKALCVGTNQGGVTVSFRGTIFHRVAPQFMVQGGDITLINGDKGTSIYGERFDDENFSILHDEEGRLGMANAGPNTNNTQFYITTVPCTHLDNINVVFGQVRKGLNIIREMGDISRIDDHPAIPCIIENCGEIKENEAWDICENDGTLDVYPPWPHDWEPNIDLNIGTQMEEAITQIKDSGNYYFKNCNYIDSTRKYKKALRYIDFPLNNINTEDSKKIKDIKVSILLNLAAVRLRTDNHQDAQNCCDQALIIDPNNVKAFYRRAQSRMGLKDYDKALLDLKSALKLHPTDKNIRLEFYNAKRIKYTYLQREKKIFAKMFQ